MQSVIENNDLPYTLGLLLHATTNNDRCWEIDNEGELYSVYTVQSTTCLIQARHGCYLPYDLT